MCLSDLVLKHHSPISLSLLLKTCLFFGETAVRRKAGRHRVAQTGSDRRVASTQAALCTRGRRRVEEGGYAPRLGRGRGGEVDSKAFLRLSRPTASFSGSTAAAAAATGAVCTTSTRPITGASQGLLGRRVDLHFKTGCGCHLGNLLVRC